MHIHHIAYTKRYMYLHMYVCMCFLKACLMLGNWHSDIIHIILIVLMLNKHVRINNTCAACICGIHEPSGARVATSL